MDETRVRQRVRSSSKPRGVWARLRKFMAASASGVNLRRALAAVIGIYLFYSLAVWYFQVSSYGVVSMNDDEGAVRYALGAPVREDAANRKWTYNLEANAILTVEFAPDGLLSRISCASPSVEPRSCPELYGIGIGQSEDALVGRLGSPSYVRISGDRKYITYAGLGATYVLQQFVVTGLVRDARRGSFLGKSWKFIRNLVYIPGGIG